MIRILAILLAAGTALTNSNAETVLTSYELPAYAAQKSKVYRIRGAVRATATNATDTLTVRLRIGQTTLTGTICASSGAVGVANNDVVVFDLTLVVRSDGSSGSVCVSGWMSAPGAEGTATARNAFEVISSFDTTKAYKLEITGEWSVANAGNSCQAEAFEVYELAA